MEFGGLLTDPDQTRYCYLRIRALKELIKDTKILDALLELLQVPGKSLAALKKLNEQEKLRLIEAQIDHFRGTKTSCWFGVPAPEVLAASIWRCKLSDKLVFKQIFNGANREEDLAFPVADWLSAQGFDVYGEIPMGTKRIDVLGYKKGFLGFGERLIGIELKNDIAQFQRGLDQMTTFREYAHAIYLACTPALAADYLDHHAEARNVHHWDKAVFHKKLKDFGFGLLLIEGETVYEVMKPVEHEPDTRKVKDTVAILSPKLKIAVA
jgi:hypothetical protein